MMEEDPLFMAKLANRHRHGEILSQVTAQEDRLVCRGAA